MFAFVDEDWCQAEPLVEFNTAVSFGMIPLVPYRTIIVKIKLLIESERGEREKYKSKRMIDMLFPR